VCGFGGLGVLFGVLCDVVLLVLCFLGC